MRSLADFIAIKGRPDFNCWGLLIVADNTRVGYNDVDYGWGKPIYGCKPNTYRNALLYFPYKNSQGQEGRAVSLCLADKASPR